MNYLNNIGIILESDPGLVIKDITKSTEKKVIDNRFNLIKQNIKLINNKDANFYTKLIKIISYYMDQLYDKSIEDFPSVVFDKNGEGFDISDRWSNHIKSDKGFRCLLTISDGQIVYKR